MIRSMTILTMALLTACVDSMDSNDLDEAGVRAGVAEVMRDYQSALNSKEWDSVIDLYADDPRFHYVEDGAFAYRSTAAAVAALRGLGEGVEDIGMEIHEPTIAVLSNDLAAVSTTYEQRMVFESGLELSLSGAFTVVLKKRDGDWKILLGHSSTPRFPAQSENGQWR